MRFIEFVQIQSVFSNYLSVQSFLSLKCAASSVSSTVFPEPLTSVIMYVLWLIYSDRKDSVISLAWTGLSISAAFGVLKWIFLRLLLRIQKDRDILIYRLVIYKLVTYDERKNTSGVR